MIQRAITIGTRLLLALGLGLPAAAPLRAQTSVPVVVVVDLALTGTALRDLDYGSLTPGVNRTVAPTETPACGTCVSGKFEIQGILASGRADRQYMHVTLSVPTSLTQAVTGATLPLSWTNGASACLFKLGVLISTSCDTWTPVAGVEYRKRVNDTAPGGGAYGNGKRDLDIWVGGTAQPAANQRAGYYFGTITMTFAYGT